MNTNSDKLFKRIEVPEWVQSHSDWSVWRMEYLYGVPSKEHRRLQQEYDEIEEKRKEARENGDKELEESLYEKFLEIGERLSEFIMSHTRRKER